MSQSHLQHSTGKPGGCWTCTHWKGETSGDPRALVCRSKWGPRVTGNPDTGCCDWEREPGADDVVPAPCSHAPD
ncbi:hypothetical protein CAL28_10790 [Bordetella genomosp. 11]|uniref:Uncharacterized protein n=1 Tax=Bordetella genomosp. 11 TaxID=1416808 RepID=A0A261UEW0_9BORD|nr:hypothetical protein CAL28_10790 [Bordetella genomosp. 11]